MGRKKKTLHDYAAEFTDLAVRRHLIGRSETGEATMVETLYCKSCELPMRVRRDRILEHLASGRHYRNRRLVKHWNHAPVTGSASADPDGSFALSLDSAHHPQSSFVLQSSSTNNTVSTSNLVPSPPPPRHAASSLSGPQNAISSTTNLLSGRLDAVPSTSSSFPSSYSSLHIQNPSVSSRHPSQRHCISEVSNSASTAEPITGRGGIGLAVIGVRHGSKALLRSITTHHGCCLHYIIENQLAEVERAFSDGLLARTRILPEQDVDVALSDQRVSGIVICSPPYVAAMMTLEALRAGKAVLCENLLSTNQQMVEACFDEAERRGKPLVCGFYKRFDPALKYLHKKLHESSGLGRIQRLSSISRMYPATPLNRIKMSGGIFYSMALHDIDVVNWLLGVSAPDTVFSLGHAFCSDMATAKDADTVNITMKLSSGTIVTLDISQHCTKTCDQRLELYGCQGSLRLDNQNPLCIIENNSSSPTISQTHQERYRNAYRELFQHFIRTITGKERPEVTKEQYLAAVQVAEAAEKSWKSGSPVDLRNEAVDIKIVKTEVV
ncbi:myo-inositol 2-dehydrogenase-like [Gastrophryne carolinensis]